MTDRTIRLKLREATAITVRTHWQINTIERGTMSDTQKPGEIPNRPGEHIERDRAVAKSHPRTVTIEPGDKPLPPTQTDERGTIDLLPSQKEAARTNKETLLVSLNQFVDCIALIFEDGSMSPVVTVLVVFLLWVILAVSIEFLCPIHTR